MQNILFTPTSDNLCWDYSNLDFAKYLAWTDNLLKKNRLDLNQENENKILNANRAFEFLPEKPGKANKKGILLVHGLLSCPLSMHDIGRYLATQGFLVRGILLPGHGTRPGDLLKATLSDWVATVKFGLDSLKEEVDEVWVGGLSGGADLALHSALVRHDIHAVLLFAPSLKLKHPLAPLTTFLNQLNHSLQLNYWPVKHKETDYAKYNSYPIHFAALAYELTFLTREAIKNRSLMCPVWMALTEDDETICHKEAKHFFLNTSHPHSQLIYYTKNPQPTADTRIIARSSSFPEEKIIDFSHACMTFSPDNPHYGRNGDYLLGFPKELTMGYFGALSRANLKQYNLQRLLYNPDFVPMLSHLNHFILRN